MLCKLEKQPPQIDINFFQLVSSLLTEMYKETSGGAPFYTPWRRAGVEGDQVSAYLLSQ